MEEQLQNKIRNLEKENQKLKQLHSETEKLSKIGSYKINLVTGVTNWTNGLYDIFGMSLNDELPTAESYYELVHPDDREKVKQMFSNSATKNIPFDLKYRILLKDGTIKNVHSKSEVQFNADGERVLFGFLRDITEEMLLVSHVSESNEKFQLLFDTLHEGVSLNKAIYDNEGNIIDHEVLLVNKAFNKNSRYYCWDKILFGINK